MNFIFPYIGNNHPNWLSYFSEGLVRHQTVDIDIFSYMFSMFASFPDRNAWGTFWRATTLQIFRARQPMGSMAGAGSVARRWSNRCTWLHRWAIAIWFEAGHSKRRQSEGSIGWMGALISGWWFGTWILFFHILGISSSQLTNIFPDGLKPPTRYVQGSNKLVGYLKSHFGTIKSISKPIPSKLQKHTCWNMCHIFCGESTECCSFCSWGLQFPHFGLRWYVIYRYTK